MTKTMYRQGDVLLVLETRQRVIFSEESKTDERLIIAHGERTGHSHSVAASDAGLREETSDGALRRFLDVRRATSLCHEEHAEIPVPPGSYRVILQRQFDPAAERPVHD